MSTFVHTQGPWSKCVGTGATELRGQPSGVQTLPRVCRVLRSDLNSYANANLIQAAPVMLEALVAIEKLAEEAMDDYACDKQEGGKPIYPQWAATVLVQVEPVLSELRKPVNMGGLCDGT
jgi:hypothetical protein